jgi:hypothetical protein
MGSSSEFGIQISGSPKKTNKEKVDFWTTNSGFWRVGATILHITILLIIPGQLRAIKVRTFQLALKTTRR